MSIFNKLLVTCALSAVTLTANAFVQGEGEPVGQLHYYYINLNSLDINQNHPGGRSPEFNWNLGGNYTVNFHCPNHDIKESPIFYSTLDNIERSSTSGRYKLNDYLDIEVSVYIAGHVENYVRAPFNDYSNRMNSGSCRRDSRGSSTTLNNVQSGSKGKVVFIVTKPIVNGINISKQALLDIAGDLGGEEHPTTPISRIEITSGIITVPDKCTFNKGQKISVEFGSLPNSARKLDGNSYGQSVPIHVECEGGSFSQGALNIELGIQTTTASGTADFNNQLLGTLSNGEKRNDLGILLRDASGSTVVPNKFYEMKGFYRNQGDWNLTAAPMANAGAGSVKEGEFEASATVVAKFQ